MRSYRLELVVCLFLILSALAAFWQVRHHEFINFDDDEYVTENPHIQAGITPKSVIWAFTAFHSNNWHPLAWLSHALDCQIFGLNPGMHHLTNVLFHTANSLLLFVVLRRMTGAVWRSAFVAAFFALHPLHVESVAWVSERKDVLSAFFWMLTLLAYLCYVRSPKPARYLLVLLAFALGLMAKPMVVTLPFVLVLTDYWPLNRFSNLNAQTPNTKFQISNFKSLVWEKIPFFVLAGVSSIVTLFAQKSGGLVRSLDMFPLDIRIGNALVSYVSYVAKMVWPQNIAFYYPHPGTALPMWKAVGSGLLLMAVSVAIIRAREKFPYLIMGWLWYLGTLVPVVGLVQVASQAMADRYTYLPFVGLFVMIVWGVPALAGRWHHGKIIAATVGVLTLLGYAAGTWFQVRHWKNSVTLFTHTLSVTENNYLANNCLGAALEEQGRITQAIDHLSEALRIKPDGVQAHYNLGVVLNRQGDIQGAIRSFSHALRFKPDFADAHYNLGIALKQQGDLDTAIWHFSQAVRVRPEFAQAHNNLGSALNDLGSREKAIAHYRAALRIRPEYAEAHNNLGTALKSQGKYKDAIRHYYQALQISPELAEAHFNLGIALGTQGKSSDAVKHFSEALRIRPEFAEAHYSMGVTLTRQKRTEEAIQHYEEALRIRPEFPVVHFNMGILLAGQGKLEGSVKHLQEAIRIRPDYAEAHNNLGSVLARQGQLEGAAAHFSEAVRLRPDFADAKKNLDLALQMMGRP